MVNIRNRANFHVDQLSCWDIAIFFSKLAGGGRQPSWTRFARVWSTYEQYLLIFVACAKIGWTRCGSFDNMQVLISCDSGLKMPIHARPKMAVMRIWLLNEAVLSRSSKASPCGETRHIMMYWSLKSVQEYNKSRVRPDHPRCRSAMWICMCGHTRDVVIYSKFRRNPFRGFGATGSKFCPSHYFGYWLLQQFVNSLYYCTSCDSVLGNMTHFAIDSISSSNNVKFTYLTICSWQLACLSR